MVFSAKHKKHKESGLDNSKLQPPAPNSTHGNANGKPNGKFNRRSYAQVVTGEKKTLLPVAPIPPSLIKEGRTILRTQLWRHGYSAGSVFIDLRSQDITREAFFLLVKDQYPSVVGVKAEFEGARKYAELNFSNGDDSFQSCLDNGLLFPNSETAILPCRALTGAMEVVTLTLAELPFERDEVLLDGLRKSLAPYGEVLDVDTLVDPVTQIYLCQGYATLNIKTAEGHTFEPLVPITIERKLNSGDKEPTVASHKAPSNTPHIGGTSLPTQSQPITKSRLSSAEPTKDVSGPLDNLSEIEVSIMKEWYEKGRIDDDDDMALDSGTLHMLKEIYRSKYADIDAVFASHNTHLEGEEASTNPPQL